MNRVTGLVLLFLMVLSNVFPVTGIVVSDQVPKTVGQIVDRQPLPRTSFFAPTVVRVRDTFLYNTSFGVYVFGPGLALRDWFTFNYTHWSGLIRIERSFFWADIGAGRLRPGPSSLNAVENNLFSVTTIMLRPLVDLPVADITLKAEFFEDSSPKFTVVLQKRPSWDLGDFRIVWILIAPHTYLKTDETRTFDFSASSSLEQRQTTIEIEAGDTNDPRTWQVSHLIHWRDFRQSLPVFVGRIDRAELGLLRQGIVIVFPVNAANIDPTTVGSSTSTTATSFTVSRRTCYANGRYWVFWSNSTSSIVYASSADGIVWTSTTLLLSGTATAHRQFSIHCTGSSVHFVHSRGVQGNDVFYRYGTLVSDGTITWDAWVKVDGLADQRYFLTNDAVTGNIKALRPSSPEFTPTNDTSTEVVIGTTASNCFKIITPLANQTMSGCGDLPSGIGTAGWLLPSDVFRQTPEGDWVNVITLRNRKSEAWSGRLWMRLWAAVGTTLSSPREIVGWLQCFDSDFDGDCFDFTAGNQQVSVSFTFDNQAEVTLLGERFFLELAAEGADDDGATAGFRVRIDDGSSFLKQAVGAFDRPSIVTDSNNIPWIALIADVFGTTSDDDRIYYSYKAADSKGSAWGKRVDTGGRVSGVTGSPFPLTPIIVSIGTGRLYIVYVSTLSLFTVTVSGRLHNGTSWQSQETSLLIAAGSLSTGVGRLSVVGENGRVAIAYKDAIDTDLYVRIRSAAGVWATSLRVATLGTSEYSPSITHNTDGDLHIYYENFTSPAAIWRVSYNSVLATWGSPATPFGTTFTTLRADTVSAAYSLTTDVSSVVWQEASNVRHGFETLIQSTVATDPGSGYCRAGPCLGEPEQPPPPPFVFMIPMLNVPFTRETGLFLGVLLIAGIVLGYGVKSLRSTVTLPSKPEFSRKRVLLLAAIVVASLGLLRAAMIEPRFLIVMGALISGGVAAGIVYLKRRG